jgi:large conductance mechanosensitive channel
MLKEFKAFLIKQNVLALAIAVVVGAATNDVIKSVVDGFVMPLIGVISPQGEGGWRAWRIPLGSPENAILVGQFLATLLNFVIVAFVAWQLTKWIIRPSPESKPPTKKCPYCTMEIDAAALRCAHCTSILDDAAALSPVSRG